MTQKNGKSKTKDPREALDCLIEGNARFCKNLSENKNLLQMVENTANSQSPFAAILSCSDSRVPIELVFDQSLGDIFSVRLAGNIASRNAIASLEYACKFLGSKLIVVMGHTKCGGVMGACDGKHIGNLDSIFTEIEPAVKLENSTQKNRTASNPEFVNNVIHLNVELQMRNIIERSRIIRKLLEDEKIGIVGALYDIETAGVHFYEEDRLFCLDSQTASIKGFLNYAQ